MLNAIRKQGELRQEKINFNYGRFIMKRCRNITSVALTVIAGLLIFTPFESEAATMPADISIDADTYVAGDTNSDNNYGGMDTVQIATSSYNKNRTFGFYRFDLSGVNKDSVTSAEFSMTIADQNGSGNRTVEVYGYPTSGDDALFKEGDLEGSSVSNPGGADEPLHLDNAPDIASNVTEESPWQQIDELTYDGSQADGTVRTWDVSDFMSESGDYMILGARMTSGTSGYWDKFYSKEHSSVGDGTYDAATLTVIPEPSTLVLLGLAGLLLMKRRRRV